MSGISSFNYFWSHVFNSATNRESPLNLKNKTKQSIHQRTHFKRKQPLSDIFVEASTILVSIEVYKSLNKKKERKKFNLTLRTDVFDVLSVERLSHVGVFSSSFRTEEAFLTDLNDKCLATSLSRVSSGVFIKCC